jgi:hypothetical protein
MATLKARPVSRDKLAALCGNNQELIRFFESLQVDSTTLEDMVTQVVEEVLGLQQSPEPLILLPEADWLQMSAQLSELSAQVADMAQQINGMKQGPSL